MDDEHLLRASQLLDGLDGTRATAIYYTILLLLFFLFCFCHMRTAKHGASDLLSLTKRTWLIDGLNVSGLKNNNVESFSQ